MRHLEIVRTGPQCLVQDLGRPGLAGQGVTLSGAVDRRSLIQGNRLLGNAPHAPGLEVLLGGLELQPDAPVLVAVTGAWCPVTVDDTPAAFGTPVLVPSGAVLRLGTAHRGLRTYLTVRGGLEPLGAFAGSWSTDTSSGIGPAQVLATDRIPLGNQMLDPPEVGAVPPATAPAELTLRMTLGPRPADLSSADRSTLDRASGTIASNSDRIGIRLNGFELTGKPAGRPSEAMPLGAVQAPPSGELIVFLADHPTTGGYPVIGVVDARDLDDLAQCPPGTPVRFAVRPPPAH
ncbi:allophanate hydrolase [Flexivirga endophytica]|uniref:Allophanate hydrolase n=1 Tax=Flexivirga endophytica TaxID=1849103 RepID=A0A916X0T6_9MICO|nr:biotin-dependent carboxyltransferase family protein [Flexivirga endophytica]GGB46137.1 allophanate hydrolase [Flexivirga endophytica]GHB69909.1 allophanate hydrolase [Flexivirga endophytica]